MKCVGLDIYGWPNIWSKIGLYYLRIQVRPNSKSLLKRWGYLKPYKETTLPTLTIKVGLGDCFQVLISCIKLYLSLFYGLKIEVMDYNSNAYE